MDYPPFPPAYNLIATSISATMCHKPPTEGKTRVLSVVDDSRRYRGTSQRLSGGHGQLSGYDLVSFECFKGDWEPRLPVIGELLGELTLIYARFVALVWQITGWRWSIICHDYYFNFQQCQDRDYLNCDAETVFGSLYESVLILHGA